MKIDDPVTPAAEATAAFIRAHHVNEAKQRVVNATRRTVEATRALDNPATFSSLGNEGNASAIRDAERRRQAFVSADRPLPIDQLVEQQARGELAKSETTDPWAPALELLKRARANGTTPGEELTKARDHRAAPARGSRESVKTILEQSQARLTRDVLGLLEKRRAAKPARMTPLAKAAAGDLEDEIVMVVPADAAIRIISDRNEG
jgi:hypothetical protein